MDKFVCVLLMFSSSLIGALSQVLLKISANKKYKSFIFEYLNPYVIISYTAFFATTILSVVGYTGLSYKYGPIIGTSSYVFVMIFSKYILKENITKNRVIGNILIIIGIIVFSL